MSMYLRSFTDFLAKKIEREGIRGEGYSDEERENDVVDMLYDGLDEYCKDEKDWYDKTAISKAKSQEGK